MIWIMYVLSALVGVVLAVGVIGLFLPKFREASRVVKFDKPIDQVWELMSNQADDFKWRSDLKQVIRLQDRGGQQLFQEIYKNGNTLSLQTTEIVPRQKLVRQIVDNKQFGGTWTFLFEGEGAGCKVTITENSELYNPIFRFFAIFMKPGATIDSYLGFAEIALGAKAEPIR